MYVYLHIYIYIHTYLKCGFISLGELYLSEHIIIHTFHEIHTIRNIPFRTGAKLFKHFLELLARRRLGFVFIRGIY